MKLTPFGHCSRTAVTTLSTWDPFLKESAAFVKLLAAYAHRHDQDAAALLIDPTPAAVVKGEAQWPYFQDVATRVDLLLECGVDAVGVISFTADDLAAGAHEFFEVITDRWALSEFWLRTHQSLGSGPKGSAAAVRTECVERSVKLRHVKRFIADVGIVTRASLAEGSVARASHAARALPTFRRPATGQVRMAWQPGVYFAVAAQRPEFGLAHDAAFPVMLTASTDGVSELQWPDPAIEYLRFTSGPADQVGGVNVPAGATTAGILTC
jgi:hypothetical protein